MNREIKFRSWNVEQEIMHDIAMPSWNGSHEVWKNNEPLTETQWLSFGPANAGILMQYSGINDKNGAEIYEGDRFRIGSGKKIFEVRFEHGCFMAFYNGKQYGLIGEIQSCFIEVVGNIYQQIKVSKIDTLEVIEELTKLSNNCQVLNGQQVISKNVLDVLIRVIEERL